MRADRTTSSFLAGLNSIRRDSWSLVALPGLAFVVLGFGSALAFTVIRSVTEPGPQNYLDLTSGLPARSLITTFRASAIVSVVVLVLGYAYAYAMRVGPRWLRWYLIAFLAVQFATSSVARSYAWVQLLQNNGVINKFLMNIGLIDAPLKLMRNDLGAIIGTTHVLMPHMILILYAAMRQVDLGTVVAARSLGAGPIRAFFQIFVPATQTGILIGTGLIFILGLSFYATPALLGSTSRQMVSALIMTQAEYGNFGRSSALSIALVSAALLSLFLISVISRRMQRRDEP